MTTMKRVPHLAIALFITTLSIAACSMVGCRGPKFLTVAECTPAEGVEVGSDCGAFVDPAASADGADGTLDNPFGTMMAAVESGATVIHVCGDKIVETVALPAGTTLYGGFT